MPAPHTRFLFTFTVVFVAVLGLPATAEDKPARYADRFIYQPSPVPDRVILTWNGDPATTQAVTWRTSTDVAKAVAEIALSEPGPGFDPFAGKGRYDAKKVTTVPAKTEPLKTDLGDAHYHSLTFTDLKPATKYVYRVGDGVNWSEWFQFRTASDKPDPLSFIYFGDAQNEVKSLWSRVVRGAYSDMPKANFVVHAGDLINKANSDGNWGEWHAAAGWINGMVPTLATPGNHEYATAKIDPKNPKLKRQVSANWRPQFAFPENGPEGLEETVYFLDVQGVRVVSLNSNERPDEQVKWLEGVLADNPNRWTVVTFHHPIYSTAKGRDNKSLRETWRPVFDKYAPDLVLQGHDHTYGRSGLMREDNLLTGAQARDTRGTVYVVSVSGPKMYAVDDEKWMKAKAQNTQLYQLIRIDGDKLHYESRTARGEVYDSFELMKGEGGRNTIVEREEDGKVGVAPAGPGRQTWFALGGMGGVVALLLVRRAVSPRAGV